MNKILFFSKTKYKMFLFRQVDDGREVTNHFTYLKNNIPFSTSRVRQLAQGTTKQTKD
jgi:hypothetical protein